jgi:hypothetical protein
LASCTGPVASGHALNTSAVGGFSFGVASRDLVGNATQSSVSYSVAYNICVLFDPWWPIHSGATFPLVLRVCDFRGTNTSAPSIVLTALGITPAAGLTVPSAAVAAAAHSDVFRYNPGLKAYVFNVKTKGLSRGTYQLQFRAGSDPTVHAVQFTVR